MVTQTNYFGTKCPKAGFGGGSPTSVFAARRDVKIASVATLALLAVSASPGTPRKTEAAPFLTLPPFLWLFVFPLRWLP